jgi:hypothetical protein
VLLKGAPENRFVIQGPVETVGETEWVVAGQAIAVDNETDIQENIAKGDLVHVEGIILEGGTLLDKRIALPCK